MVVVHQPAVEQELRPLHTGEIGGRIFQVARLPSRYGKSWIRGLCERAIQVGLHTAITGVTGQTLLCRFFYQDTLLIRTLAGSVLISVVSLSCPDPMHTCLGLAGLSLNKEPGLNPLLPSLTITRRAADWMETLHRKWRSHF